MKRGAKKRRRPAPEVIRIDAAIEEFALTRTELLTFVAHGHVFVARTKRGVGLLLSLPSVRAAADMVEMGRLDHIDCCANSDLYCWQVAQLVDWETCEAIHVARYFRVLIEKDRVTTNDVHSLLDYRDTQLRHRLKLQPHGPGDDPRTNVTTVRCSCKSRLA